MTPFIIARARDKREVSVMVLHHAALEEHGNRVNYRFFFPLLEQKGYDNA
jgi:hypothetical protein